MLLRWCAGALCTMKEEVQRSQNEQEVSINSGIGENEFDNPGSVSEASAGESDASAGQGGTVHQWDVVLDLGREGIHLRLAKNPSVRLIILCGMLMGVLWFVHLIVEGLWGS